MTTNQAVDVTTQTTDAPLGTFEFWSRPPHEREEAFRVLRETSPVSYHRAVDLPGVTPGEGFWAVTSHQAIHTASRQPELSNTGGVLLADLIGDPALAGIPPALIAMDDPEHARLRSAVVRGFTPRGVATLEESVRQMVVDIIESIAPRGECDFVRDVAAELPLRVICTMMGIDESRYQEMFDRTNALIGGEDPEYAATPDARARANYELTAYGQELADEKLRNPGDDLASRLVATAEDGERITPAELASFFRLLVAAGNETTRNAITGGMAFLTDNPEQRAKWVADFDGYAPTAIEEILRFSSPLLSMRRTALADFTLGGELIHAGDKVLLIYGSGNRDADVFDNPDSFDITREPNPHMAFGGGGSHFCLGAHLARLEIKILFEELLRRLPDIRLTGDPDYLRSTFVTGVKRVRAEWTPR